MDVLEAKYFLQKAIDLLGENVTGKCSHGGYMCSCCGGLSEKGKPTSKILHYEFCEYSVLVNELIEAGYLKRKKLQFIK